MDKGRLFRHAASGFNKAMLPLLGSGLGRRVLGGSMAVLTYRGRRSGREFTLPVAYRREGAEILIEVAAPSAKTWWRNFLGDGAELQLRMGDDEVAGHAVATRDARGRVRVRVTPSAA